MKARAFAHTNIALIKYWGKRDAVKNLPATDSLSLTLKAFGTDTTVALNDGPVDELTLNGTAANGSELARVSRFLDLVRDRAKSKVKASIHSQNHVPTAAGLASSASAFAALALAATRAYGLNDLPPRELSVLARQGSGSAARSIFGGWVHMQRGHQIDGSDAFAVPLPESELNLGMLVVPCHQGPKEVSSTAGMTHTEQTSPYFDAWCKTHDHDVEAATSALRENDFEKLGKVMEHSTLKMHATALTAQPGLWYWNAETWRVLETVKQSRTADLNFFFTMDAGPHVKVLVPHAQATRVKQVLCERLARRDDEIWYSEPGGPAQLLEVS